MSSFASLPQHPTGFAGKVFGWVMERLNAGAYRAACDALKPVDDEHYLEIGFGTGRFVEHLLEVAPACRVSGLDPSPTMVDVARHRKGIRAKSNQVDLRQGDASYLPWQNSTFDAIVAIHSFQFWGAPELSMQHIARALRADGRFVCVFRDHSRRAPAWLPNPMSRSGNEVESASKLFIEHGFLVREETAEGTSRVLVGRRAGL